MSQPMRSSPDTERIEEVRARAHPLNGDPHDYDPLIDLTGAARIALLGAASHGTHEFYRERAEITKRLIKEKGFTAVALEGDWPDAYRVSRYVRGMSDDADASKALEGFQRFPAWMWRNTDIVEFVEWLRAYNDALPAEATKVGLYGLDLYNLRAAREAVLLYLEKIDPRAADRTRASYACLDHYSDHSRGYGVLAALAKPCKDESVSGLVELQESRAVREARRAGPMAEEEFFNALQNARVVRNAEGYYRSMYRAEVSTWNLREQHLTETLNDLFAHLNRKGERAKIAVWAHNSHLGDARGTEKGEERELSVGQLVRQRHGGDAVLVGLTTNYGTVTAASDWDTPAEIKEVRPALPNSYEELFHHTRLPRFLLAFRERDNVPEALRHPRLERSIGIIYHSETPEIERTSHYFNARLAKQFDAVVFFDETRAVEPLELAAANTGEVPGTYPFEV
jgi:erythromycin esterase-like protein